MKNGSETDRNQLYHIHCHIFFRIENLDMEMKSNIIEYKYEANTSRNEYGNEYLPVYKKIPQIKFLIILGQYLQHLYRQFYRRSHNRM